MVEEQFDNMPSLTLNFLPASFSDHKVTGFILDYEDEFQLRNLQDRYKDRFLLRRGGRKINAVPLVTDYVSLHTNPVGFSIKEDWSLFSRLLEEGVRRFLRTRYQTMRVPEYGTITIRAEGEKNDLIKEALSQQRFILSKLGFIHIYRKYSLTSSFVRRNSQNQPLYGVLIDVSTSWQVVASVADLISKGINVRGCYVVPLDARSRGHDVGNKTAGSISEIVGNDLHLLDARDQEVVDAREYTIDASLDNVTRCANALLGQQGTLAMRLIRAEVGKLMSAEGQLGRIARIAEPLSQGLIHCANGLDARIDRNILKVDAQSSCRPLTLEPPKYVLRYGREPVGGMIASALSSQGPFDQDSFSKTTPHVLVITPKQSLGRVEQFLRAWRDGGLQPPYRKGFVNQYRLRNCDFHFVDFQETVRGPTEDYRQACIRALQDSRDMVRRYDLAFVVIREEHRLLGIDDPYLIAKAALMNDGVPVQEIEIETINLPADNQSFILNNIALASYTKLGGIPWLLASSKGQGIAHELIIGLGSAIIRDGRLQGQERYVGITTLFNYDGVYQVSNVSRESLYEEYSQALQSALSSSLQYVSAQKGWQPGDRVRLIFHTSKPMKNLEIECVKRLVSETLSEYDVDFAFLVVGQDHEWTVYSPSSQGFTDKWGRTRGRQVPKRGTLVLLDDQRALLSVTGPTELKTPEQGCPSPLQIRLNGASTFRDLEYLSRQVFEFTYMSWKTFNLLPRPATITYSETIASLLGRLRRVKNWNSDVLQTTQLRASLWFL